MKKSVLVLLVISSAAFASPNSSTSGNPIISDSLIKGTVDAMATRRGIKCDEGNPTVANTGVTNNDAKFELVYACDFGNTVTVDGYIEDSQVQVNSFTFNK